MECKNVKIIRIFLMNVLSFTNNVFNTFFPKSKRNVVTKRDEPFGALREAYGILGSQDGTVGPLYETGLFISCKNVDYRDSGIM